MRINGEVQRELSNIIRSEVKDPRIAPMTSVVAVEVAPDLKPVRRISVYSETKKLRIIQSKVLIVQKGIFVMP